MDHERRDRVDALFEEALKRRVESRKQFLAKACEADGVLCGEVSSLLRAFEASVDFLEVVPSVPGLPGAALPPGMLLSERFEIVRLVGRGGMGEVYEAWDRELGTSVALKTIRRDVPFKELGLDRFHLEIRLARTVASPSVCRIFDLYHHRSGPSDEEEPVDFVTMELLSGETLGQRLEAEGPLPWREALAVLRQVAKALEATAKVGIVHRDLKPDNVMLVPGEELPRAVVMDFGLASALADGEEGEEGEANLGVEGPPRASSRAAWGTPAYMSPEQLAGEPVDLRSDLFSFGVVAYEALSGGPPFESAPNARLMEHFDRPPTKLRDTCPEIPRELEAIVHRCLSAAPSARFRDASDLAAALEAVGDGATTRRKILLGGALAAAGALFAMEHGTSIAGFVSGLVPRVLRLEDFTRSPEVLSALREGFALMAAGENLASIAAFERALELEPKLALAHLERIHALLNVGEDERAGNLLARFTAVSGGAPYHPYIRNHLETMRRREALDYQGAMKPEERLLHDYRDDLHVRLSHAQRLEEAGLLREAIEVYEPMASESVAALLGLGRGLVFTEQSRRAVDQLGSHDTMDSFGAEGEARGMLHAVLGTAHRDLGNLRAAAEHCERALDLRRRVGDLRGVCGTATNLAVVYKMLARFEEATKLVEGALAMARASGDRTYESFALLTLSRIHIARGAPAEALPYLRESTAIEMQRREVYEMATRLLNLAWVYAALTRHEEALLFLEQSEPYVAASSSPGLDAYGWRIRAQIELAQGELDAAEGFAARSGAAYESKGLALDVVDANLIAARADHGRGRFANALERVSHSRHALEGSEYIVGWVSTCVVMVELLASLGDWAGVESGLDELYQRFDGKSCYDSAPRTLLVRGRLRRVHRDWDGARESFEAAVEVARRAGYRDLEILGRVEMARTLVAVQENEVAAHMLDDQLDAARRAALAPVELEARVALAGLLLASGEPAEAAEQAGQAVRLAESRGLRLLWLRALLAHGEAFRCDRELESAASVARNAGAVKAAILQEVPPAQRRLFLAHPDYAQSTA